MVRDRNDLARGTIGVGDLSGNTDLVVIFECQLLAYAAAAVVKVSRPPPI